MKLKFTIDKDGMDMSRAKVFFSNGYGASIVTGGCAHGDKEHPYEVAVMAGNCAITYDTPLTSDVVGYLDEAGVDDLLAKIEKLPKRKESD